MALRRSVGVVVLFAVALVVSGQRLTSNNVKVTGESSVKIQKSINHESKHPQNSIHQDDHFVNHKMQEMENRRYSLEEMFDFNETDFHSLAGKPSKFDRDISELIHTDLKSMHDNEAARLESERVMEKSNNSTNIPSKVTTTVDTNGGPWNLMSDRSENIASKVTTTVDTNGGPWNLMSDSSDNTASKVTTAVDTNGGPWNLMSDSSENPASKVTTTVDTNGGPWNLMSDSSDNTASKVTTTVDTNGGPWNLMSDRSENTASKVTTTVDTNGGPWNLMSDSSENTASKVTTTVDTNGGPWTLTRRTDTLTYDEETILQDGIGDDNGRCNGTLSMACLEKDLEHFVEKMSTYEVYNITDFAQIVKNSTSPKSDVSARENSVIDKVARYAKQHILKIRMPSELSLPRGSRTFFGAIFQEKSSFLTGFGLGFLAFGLQKLMLPLFIGMQIVKSVLIALFLPSIIGGIGKILGKGVSSFSQVSQSAAAQPEESFEFKDNADIYNDDYMHNQPIGTLPASQMYGNQDFTTAGNQYTGTPGANQRISYVNALSDNYYSRNSMQGATKRQDYKIFHEIPTSSLLLTNYDPFYSPLLSRLDAVFSRLGHSTEGCREYAICAMYKSPARYAPYSNLVSAQLSRELNELRKPTSDNPDVLRFFKYMKAAKDGQDGVQCEDIYAECASRENSSGQNQAMLATYQDINKLVQARKI